MNWNMNWSEQTKPVIPAMLAANHGRKSRIRRTPKYKAQKNAASRGKRRSFDHDT